MLDNLIKPSFLIPFALIAPYLFLGNLGVTFFEIIIISGFLYLLIKGKKLPKEGIILIFCSFLLLGYGFSAFNGALFYGLSVGLGDLKIFYWLLLALAGFYIGYFKYESIHLIPKSKFFKFSMFILCTLIICYPFISIQLKNLILAPYINVEGSLELTRYDSIRFPGLGVNSNIYAFMYLCIFHLVVLANLNKNVSFLYSFYFFVSLMFLGSKTIMGVSIVLLFASILFNNQVSQKSKVIFISLNTFIAVIAFLFLTNSKKGKELSNNIAIINRLSDSAIKIENGGMSPFQTRIEHWKLGMDRVMLDPFFGVKSSSNNDDSNLIDFCCPHNEFISYWTFTGFLGLIAFLFLIISMIIKNIGNKNGLFWILLYGALSVHMFIDAVFQAPRFIPFFFIFLGLNVQEIRRYKTIKKEYSDV